jgi:ribosome-binding factor A
VARRLSNVATFVQREVSRRLRLRVTPKVRFEFDSRVGQGSKVLELLAELKREDGTDTGDHR